MPIFDYSCKACGHSFDILQKLGADPLTDCPECGQPELKKLLSAPAFHLKGKGWRKSDDTPKKPNVRPKFAHTFDSATPHAEHSDSGATGKGHSHGHSDSHKDSHSHESPGHGHSHEHGHNHGPVEDSGGIGKIVRDHVNSHNHGSEKKSDSSGDHGHSHGHSHKHD